MFKKWICLFGLALLVPTICADDAPRPRSGVKQRVDPKLLREAIALPEYQGQGPESSTLLLEDLQRLADKLKKNGDAEASDLLERFIYEHQRLVKQAAHHSALIDERMGLLVRVVEVNFDDVPTDSILHSQQLFGPKAEAIPAESSNQIVAELDRMIATRRARTRTEPVLPVRSDGNVHHHSVAEVPVPIGTGSVMVEFREFGTLIEVLPTIIGKEKIRLRSVCENARKNGEAGKQTERCETTIDMNLGESAIHSTFTSHPGHRIFVIYKLAPRI